VHFILRSRKESKKATNANKITIDKREAKNNARETKETKVEAKKTKANIEANARATTIATTTTTIAINKKQLLRMRERFACTHVSFVLKITSMLLSYLLLFNNSQRYASNTLYNQKLIKLLN